MSLLNRFRHKKIEDEPARLLRLRQTGRIADGVVIDINQDDEQSAAAQIFYTYSIGGIEYQSSQTLSDDQRARLTDYAPGARITVRYDPRQPGNSVVV